MAKTLTLVKLLIQNKMLGRGTADRSKHLDSRALVLFRQARGRKCRVDPQTMTEVLATEVRGVVVETLAEQQRLWREDVDAVVLKAVANTLASFGLEEDDRSESRADLLYLRRWRRSIEQAQSYAFKAVITVIVTGAVGAVWLGIKAVTLGK